MNSTSGIFKDLFNNQCIFAVKNYHELLFMLR